MTMKLSDVDKRLSRQKVYRKNAECVLELLMLYRELPSGEMRDVVCTTMNELAHAMTDLQYFLQDGAPSPSLVEAMARQPLGESQLEIVP